MCWGISLPQPPEPIVWWEPQENDFWLRAIWLAEDRLYPHNTKAFSLFIRLRRFLIKSFEGFWVWVALFSWFRSPNCHQRNKNRTSFKVFSRNRQTAKVFQKPLLRKTFEVVPPGRLELPHPKIADFESAASTNSTTGALSPQRYKRALNWLPGPDSNQRPSG